MKPTRTLAVTVLGLGLSLCVWAQDFGWFSQFEGSCWRATFPDGTTVHRQCYTRQFDKFIRGTAELHALKDGKQEIVFKGDSLFAPGASPGTIDYYIWGSDGTHRQLQARYISDELHFPVPSRSDPARVAVRSVWKRLDESRFEVRRERPDGDTWTLQLRVVYTREK